MSRREVVWSSLVLSVSWAAAPLGCVAVMKPIHPPPTPAVSDPALERETVSSYGRLKKKMQWSDTNEAKRAWLMDEDWRTDRNRGSGVVVGRSRTVMLGFLDGDGHCWSHEYRIVQEVVGGRFDAKIQVGPSDRGDEYLRIDCASLK